MEKLLSLLARLLRPLPRPAGDPIDHPEIRAMDLRMLADLPFPRPDAPAPQPRG